MANESTETLGHSILVLQAWSCEKLKVKQAPGLCLRLVSLSAGHVGQGSVPPARGATLAGRPPGRRPRPGVRIMRDRR